MIPQIESGLEQLAGQMQPLTFTDLPELEEVKSCPNGSFADWCALKPEISQFEAVAKAELMHLEHVFQEPKSKLIRREERISIERVSRFRPRALTQLANHSEDWEARTVSGVRPRRLYAELNDEEYDRLEHRIAVVLIDRLDHYLTRRCKVLKDLLQELSDFQQTEETQRWYRRIDRAYSLFLNFKADEFGKSLQHELQALEILHRRVRRLKNTKLYQSLPKKLINNYQPTNLFTFDTHYRGVARLWLAQLKTQKIQSQQEQQSEQTQFREAFNDYCFLLVIRALEQMRFHTKTAPYHQETLLHGWISGWKLKHHTSGHIELINPDAITQLTIIPFANSFWTVKLDKIGEVFANQKATVSPLEPQLVVIHLALEETDTAIYEPKTSLRQDSKAQSCPFGMVSVSPQRIFSVERIARAIMWAILGTTYFKKQKVQETILRQCPICGSGSASIEHRNEDFESQCAGCKARWGVRRHTNGQRYPILIPNNTGHVQNWKSLEQLFGRDLLTPPEIGDLPIQKFVRFG
jgi:hypothetical protein